MKSLAASLCALATSCLLLSAWAGHARADSLDDIFTAGNRAYFAGDYTEAGAAYQRLVEAGIDDPDVYYNQGLAHAQGGAHGRALVALERAMRIRPGDHEAGVALEKVQDALMRRRAQREGEASFASQRGLLGAIGHAFPEPLLAYGVLVLNLLTFAALAGLVWIRRESARIALWVTAPIAACLLVLAGLALAERTGAFDDEAEAIVVADRAVVREGPDPRAPEAGEVREGDRVQVLSRHGNYFEILLRDASRAWVSQDAVGLIDVL